MQRVSHLIPRRWFFSDTSSIMRANDIEDFVMVEWSVRYVGNITSGERLSVFHEC